MSASTSQSTRQTSPAARLGPIMLASGVTARNGWTLVFISLSSIGLLTFVAIGTPYILNANLNIPVAEQGTIVGDLALLTEVVLLLAFGPFGVLADRIGRRRVYASGMLAMTAAYLLYPFAETVAELAFYRVIYAIGIGAATGMLLTILSDYPHESSRGKMVALAGILNAIGVIAVTVFLGRLPAMFVGLGLDGVTAGRYTHGVVAACCLVTAVVAWLGLKRGTPVHDEQRPPVKELIRSSLTGARNPRLALAYACAFVARSDLVVLGTFTVLWGTTAAVSQGIDAAEAVSRGRVIFATTQVAALLWSPVAGFIMDRVNRVTGITICMGLASLGYLSMLLVRDPLADSALIWFVLLGIGQISAFFGATTLIGQEAPLDKRGSVVGAFNICGAMGILLSTGVGGRLFDAVGPAAPFAMIGVLNGLIALAAIVIRLMAPGPMPDEIRARQELEAAADRPR